MGLASRLSEGTAAANHFGIGTIHANFKKYFMDIRRWYMASTLKVLSASEKGRGSEQ
jgi:hypothetical protein